MKRSVSKTARARILLIAMLAFVLFTGTLPGDAVKSADAAPAFAKGADISWVAGLEAQGYTWKDKNGVTRDIFDILKNDYQINSARIRVWVSPNMSDYANGYLNVDKAAALAKRAKAAGMSIMLSLHYSDSWADPGKQTKPAAWSSYTFSQLMDAVYNYTVYVMNTMKNNGVTPDWVQIGNETNDGMLWNDGKASVNMKNYAWLVTTGNNAVKSVSSTTKTIVHLANGYDNSVFVWNIGGLISNGATFDYIGMSLYPTASDWSAKVDQTISNANDMISRYGKSVMICEIGLDYSQPTAAKNFVTAIKTKVRSISGGKGLGVFYWEPESPPGYNGGYSMGAWGTDGKPTAALEGFLN